MKLIDLENDCWICFAAGFFKDEKLLSQVYKDSVKDLSQQELFFYGKKILMPRLTAWYGEKEYKYSGTVNVPKKMPPSILKIRNEIENSFSHLPGFGQEKPVLNSVLCNYYRDGGDSINWHSDDESMLGPTEKNVLIASVTFGYERRFILKNKQTKQKMTIMLGQGDVLVMGGQAQKYWVHKIPKTSKATEPRLNLTFRVIK